MKRALSKSRPSSPTPTAFSGISNYRSESFRGSKNVPAMPAQPMDYRQISKTHFDELSKYLASYLARAAPNSRSSARQKLTRLTIQQFHELSTDVFDELMRRKTEKEVPFLPVREEFHPKRNQARQKLATLPSSRFEDLSSDVYYELLRRYPEFKENPSGGRVSTGSNYEDVPAPDFPARTSTSRASGRASDRAESTYSRRRPSEDLYGGRTSGEESFPSRRKPSQDIARRQMSQDASARRQGSMDTSGRRSEDREYPGRRPSAPSVSGTSEGTVSQSATATSGMVIPTKSTMEEEYIEVPYGREVRESGSTTQDERDRSRNQSQDVSFLGPINGDEPDSSSEYPTSPRSAAGGLSGLSARLREDDDEPLGARSDEYPERLSYGRQSAASDRSLRLNGRSSVTGGGPGGEDQERMRRDYEYRIATMQNQITGLQRDLDEANARGSRSQGGDDRALQLEQELEAFKKRAEEQSMTMRSLQKELEDLRETSQREKEREVRRARTDEDELQILRDRCEQLEQEREERGAGGGGADAEAIEQLNADMASLLTELTQLSRRNEELMNAKDADRNIIRDLDNQLKEYKRKYEQAKTEVRSMKATSQLYLQAPKLDKLDDQLPVTADGGVLDIHLTGFMTAIDSLLTAARSNAPTRVLTPMKGVVNAVSAITDDVRVYERGDNIRPDVDVDGLRALRDRADATLENLVAATKTHATSSGMSPVSLMDAAASHVAATVTDIVKIVYLRRATKAEQDKFAMSSSSPSGGATNGFSPSLRSVMEKEAHHRKQSSGLSTGSRQGTLDGFRARANQSDQSSSENTSSPPPIFDRPGVPMSDDSTGDTVEDNWNELRPYIDTQTSAVIESIQSVLSSVRSPTPSTNLGDNVTQIITIVSSIVAVCKDNLPPRQAEEGTKILQELSEHANQLSEVQALPEITKESRQVMARASFAVANAMKALCKL